MITRTLNVIGDETPPHINTPPLSIYNYIDTDYVMYENNDYYHEHLSITSAVSIINKIYSNSINVNSPRLTEKNKYISIDLKPHQQALLYEMINREKELLKGPYYNQVGILGSMGGSGKTLVTLAHIAYCKLLEKNDNLSAKVVHIHKNAYSCTVQDMKIKSSAPVLVIVSDKSYDYWRNEIREHTFLNPLYIDKPRDLNKLIDNNNLIEKMNQTDFILLNNKIYNKAVEEFNNLSIIFKRVYINDPEILSFKKHSIKLNPGFIWLITHSWYHFIPNILFYPSAYLRNTDEFDYEWKKELDESVITSFSNTYINTFPYFEKFMSYSSENYKQVIRCRKDFITESFSLPAISSIEYQSVLSRKQRALIPTITQKISEYIEEADISNAYYELGVETITHYDLLEKIKVDILNEKENFINDQNISGIIACDNKYNGIVERLSLDNECPVCFDKLNNATYLPCCKQCVCGVCAIKLITPTCKMKCIYCRRFNTMNDIKFIGNVSSPDDNVKNKFQQIAEYILGLSDESKVIIYAKKSYELMELFSYLKQYNITHMFLGICSKTYAHRTINLFEKNNCRVLCVTQDAIQESIRLYSTTHIITFYRLSYPVKELLLSRLRSFGCSETLHYVSFLYQNGIQDLTSLLVPERAQYLLDFSQ
jgi:hypothetical protein